LRDPPDLSESQRASFAAAAAEWPDQKAFQLEEYSSSQAALDGYAAFHAAALQRQREPPLPAVQSLVFVPNQ
jgi:hypothetical protein